MEAVERPQMPFELAEGDWMGELRQIVTTTGPGPFAGNVLVRTGLKLVCR